MQKLKKAGAIFFLLLFLFPFAEKGIHDFLHEDVIQCTHADKHFHSAEHHCELCDFTGNFNVLPSFNHSGLLLIEPAAPDFFFAPANIPLREKDFLALRGPPSLV